MCESNYCFQNGIIEAKLVIVFPNIFPKPLTLGMDGILTGIGPIIVGKLNVSPLLSPNLLNKASKKVLADVIGGFVYGVENNIGDGVDGF